MSETRIVGCEQDGCPILDDGRCLEGFAEGEGCPHALRDVAVAATENVPGVSEDEEAADGPEESPARGTTAEIHVELGGDDSLTLPQADRLATAYGSFVVLVAGEFQSGKTTLVAELYGGFLRGRYCGWSFAGSDSLYTLDRRYHTTRAKSGLDHPDMPRTDEEEMRLLDLRVHGGRRILPFMFSDVRGEFFDNVSQGAAVENEVPLAARSDAVLVLVDGEKVGDRYLRTETLQLTRLLIAGLTEEGGLAPDTPLAIVLAKKDKLDETDTVWFVDQAQRLQEFAAVRGCAPVEVFLTAARPDESPHAPLGLDSLFEWLCEDRAQPLELPPEEADQVRSFWRTAA